MKLKFLAMTFILLLTLSLCVQIVFNINIENTAPVLYSAANIKLVADKDTFSPQDKILTDGELLYFSARDTAGLLQLKITQSGNTVLLQDTAGQIVLKLDLNKKTMLLNNILLKQHIFVLNDIIYLPLSEIAGYMGVWVGEDERTGTVFFEPGGTNQYNGISVNTKTRGASFLFYRDKTWQADTLRGVNMGVTLPGQTTATGNITYQTYLRWFGQILRMNANSIRVYTRQPPAFYKALYDFNKKSETALLLYQGVWVEQRKSLDSNTIIKTQQNARTITDIIHGAGNINGTDYDYDVSPWLAGWIIGSEWETQYINNTNTKSVSPYKGKYLYTVNGTPSFETGLCSIGDALIAYQGETYGLQVPVAFLNWSTTDGFKHPSDPILFKENASLNTELILAGKSYYAGLFAVYHVYPTFPEFIAQETENNGYAEYIAKLFKSHAVPVVMGEYGASSSRGISHRGQDGWYSQGGLNEKQQGEQDAAMTRTIFDSGFEGAFLFTWQDEWFKDVWNIQQQTIPGRNQYWYNVQNSEQSYGVLGIFPGRNKPPAYIDGDPSEWTDKQLLTKNENGYLYAQYDEGYLYLMICFSNAEIAKKNIYIPISIDENTGLSADNDSSLYFEYKSQFLVELGAGKEARILVSATHDIYDMLYGNSKKIKDGTFHPIYQYLRGEYIRPDNGVKVPRDIAETGLLRMGITNPNASSFDSLADYYINKNCIEIRIPWNLIGFMDPSQLKVMQPLKKNSNIKQQDLIRLRIGFGIENQKDIVVMPVYNIKPWQNNVIFHERLKQSYYAMQKVFSEYWSSDGKSNRKK